MNPKLTTNIKKKLMESYVFSRGNNCSYFGKYGRYCWNSETGNVEYYRYDTNYNGKENVIGNFKIWQY